MCHVENAFIFVENSGSQNGCSLDRNSNRQFCIATDSSVKLLEKGDVALHEFHDDDDNDGWLAHYGDCTEDFDGGFTDELGVDWHHSPPLQSDLAIVPL
jgi:hypothetical protein